jgi:putative ABC transport system permease protein
MLTRLSSRLRALWNRRRLDSDLDKEIRFHLSEEADDRAAAGLAPDEAMQAAKRDFGNAALIRETTRELWGWPGAERLIQDARYALRMARRQPAFSMVAVMTLALGIGATTAVLNVVSSLVLRRLPFPDGDRLVVLFATTPGRGVYRDTTSFFDFLEWKNQTRAFTDVAAYRQDRFNITGDGTPEPLTGLQASHELLSVLGVSPVIGRSFDGQEQHGGHAVAMISHGLWTRRYAGDPRILERTILLNEVSHSVVGVLPPGFQFPAFHDTDVIVPVPERPCRSCGYIRAVAHLKAGIPVSAAQLELDAVAARLARAFPDSNEGRGVNVVLLHEVVVGPVRTPLLVLLGAGVFVLLIGCGNVANLVLARGLARQRELAVRSALGAGSGRLVRQLLTESVVLALIAALFGAFLALEGSSLLVASLSQRSPMPEITFNWRMLAFGILTAVLSGLLSGLAPALMAWRSDLNKSLQENARSHSFGVTHHRLRGLLVVSQTALTVVLLIGAGLLLKSFILLQRLDLGLNPRHVLTVDLLLAGRYADQVQRETYLREVVQSIRRVPGVQYAAAHTNSVFGGGGSRETFTIEGRPDPGPKNGHPAGFSLVGESFFDALGMTVVAGRPFDSRDEARGAPVAMVNESMARHFGPGGAAVGRRMRLYYDKDPQRWLSIVGVVRDARYRYAEFTPQVFVPHRQSPYGSLPYAAPPFVSLVVRTATDPAALAPSVRAAIWAVDKDQPIVNLESMEQVLRRSVSEPRIYTLLLGIFAAIALVIASAGIYGVSAYAVVQRTREIGIRLAVGATSGQILSLVLRQGMTLTLTGVAIGAAGALAAGCVVSGFLYGVRATDAPTFVAVLVLFAAVAFVSTYMPARRAAKIDPAAAFRHV